MLFFRCYRRRILRRRLTMLLPLLLTLLILTPVYIIYKPPHLLIRYFQHRWPDVLFHVPLPPTTDAKIIALTIDDAPSPHTAEIASILAENDASATFFLIGSQIPSRENTLVDLVAQGHELANHAMHDEPSKSLPNDVLSRELVTVNNRILDAYRAAGVSEDALDRDQPHRYFRPGSGFFSARMRALVRVLGFRIVLGSVYPHDAQVQFPWLNARHILGKVRPGSIVVCHDRREWTAPMLRRLLPELKRRGYAVVTVSGLLRERERLEGES